MTSKPTPLAENINPYQRIKDSEVYNYINMILMNTSNQKDLNHIFAEKAMLLSKSYKTTENDKLAEFSKYISENLNVFSDCIGQLRSQIISKKSFKIELRNNNSVECFMIKALFSDFEKMGMIGKCTYDVNSNTINGSFINNQEFYNYINGDFYEIFAYYEAKKVLEELSEAYDVEYELYKDVYVHIPIGNQHVETRELDLLIRFDDRVYVVEVKSGSNHKVRNFYTLNRRLGLDTFCSMILIPSLNKGSASKIEDFYKVYVADSNCFADKLSQMIKERFLSDETYDDYIYWQEDNDINNYDSQDYISFIDEEEAQSYFDNGFDEGFREGYTAGEIDSGSMFHEYQKHIIGILLLCGRFSEEEIAFVSKCDSNVIEEVREILANRGWSNCVKEIQNYISVNNEERLQ